ncbi:hypothetical protein [Arthrobacter sp. C152]
MSIEISTGNLRRYLTGCPCGRAFETDAPLAEVPEHEHNHQLVIDPQYATPAKHTCTGCTWTVETYTPLDQPATQEAIRKAFDKHLLILAAGAAA